MEWSGLLLFLVKEGSMAPVVLFIILVSMKHLYPSFSVSLWFSLSLTNVSIYVSICVYTKYIISYVYVCMCVYVHVCADNQNHLQALRHLYVLATEERCLSTLDVDLQQSVSLEVQVRLRSKNKRHDKNKKHPAAASAALRLKSPTLLPELSTVESITVCSPDHFGASIQFGATAGAGGDVCACCDPGRRPLPQEQQRGNGTGMVGLRASSSPSSSSSSSSHSADLQRMQRCSRCPNATVLYVKRREAEAWNRESDMFEGSAQGQLSEYACY